MFASSLCITFSNTSTTILYIYITSTVFSPTDLHQTNTQNSYPSYSLLLFFSLKGEKQDELYLNLVLEYVPETVYSISRQHQKSKIALPLLYVKLYLYQLSRALSHIHALGICHRDIKPQNLLVNPENQQLKLCDFGSAKALVKGEPNVSYICSRYYRAPELIFGSTDYSTAIDIWSQGECFDIMMID